MGKEKYIFNLAKSIAKSIGGDLSEEESQSVKEWGESSIYNSELLRSFKSVENLEDKFASYSKIDWKEDYSKFIIKKNKKEKRIKIYSFLKYAAAIVLPVAITLTFLTIEKPDYSKQLASTKIETGSSKATLVLASGEKIYLSGDKKNTLQEKDGSLITTDSGVISYKKEKVSRKKEISKPIYNSLNVPRGGEYFLTLADGTKVWVNSETKLKYPVSFSGKQRIVYLTGEAYFDVTKNPEKPFIVVTKDAKIKVLGTSFNVKAYEENEIAATLVEGSVSIISPKNKKEIILCPGEQGLIEKNTGNIIKKNVDISLYTAWKDGRFVFRKTKMDDILKTLSRWYDIDIFYQNEEVKNITFTGNIKRYSDFDNIIDIIETTKRVKFKVKGKIIIVQER